MHAPPAAVSHPAGHHEPLARRIPWTVVLIITLASCLRFLYLGEKSLWLDEISSVTFARLDGRAFWELVRAREANMLLYYLVLRGWMHLGDSEFVLRLLSVTFGVATIPVYYVLAKDFFGRQAALISTLLLAVNGAHVRASQWIRSYSLLLLLIVLSSLFLARGLQKPSWRNWVMYALTTALAIYNHFMVGLLILAQWTSLLFLSPLLIPRKQLITTIAAILILGLPAAGFALTHNVGQLNWVANPRAIELYHTLLFLAAGGGKMAGNLFLVICVAALVITAVDFRRIWAGAPRSFESWRYAFLFACAFLPTLLAFALSFWKPIFFYRYLIISLPALLLLVGRGCELMRPRLLRAVLAAAVGLSLTAVSMSHRPEEDWKGAMHYLLSNARPGDAVFFNGQGRMPLDYYRWRMYGDGGGPKLEFPGYPSAGHAGQIFAHFYPRVWFVHFPAFVIDLTSTSVEDKLKNIYKVRVEKRFKAVDVVLYETAHQ